MITFKLPTMKNFKVDWTNHIVGFVSTLLGIFIAFQLDDWQDRRAQEARTEINLQAIKKEIENNITIYKNNISKLSQFVEYYDVIMSCRREPTGMILSESKLNSLRLKNERFNDIKFLKKLNDTLSVYTEPVLVFDLVPEVISTDNWEAAKSSGILNHIDQSRMALLTGIYNWTNKDLGIDEASFYANLFGVVELPDVPTIIQGYKSTIQTSELRLNLIERKYKEIDWVNKESK